MICHKCERRIVQPAVSAGVCEQCGAEIWSGNSPANKFCPACSYLYNVCEVCGDPILHRPVILSILPQYWEKIMSGQKTLELRLSAPICEPSFPVLVYVSKRKKSLVGAFFCTGVETIQEPTAEMLEQICVTEQEFNEYAKGRAVKLWRISNVECFRNPVPIEKIGLKQGPQSWRYFDKEVHQVSFLV